jgi:two-component system sensor histidine kinase KdpD
LFGNEYVRAAGAVLLVTGLGLLVRDRVQPIDVAMLFLLAVVFVASRFSRGPSVFAGVATVALFDFLFVPPYYTFSVLDRSYVLSFVVMFAIALLMGQLTGRIREQAQDAVERERQTNALYQMTRELAVAGEADAQVAIAARHIGHAAGGEAIVLLLDRLPGGAGAPQWPAEGPMVSMDVRMAASWAVEHGEPAGWSAVHGADAEAIVVPLKTPTRIVGIAVVRPEVLERRLSEAQLRTIEALGEQAAIALERSGVLVRHS